MASVGFAAGYFGVWTALGLFLYPLGAAFNALAMRSEALAEATPLLGGAVLTIAGALQLAPWKARRLARCHHEESRSTAPGSTRPAAWRAGARLGLQCAGCCAPWTAVLLVAGVMDLLAMALVALAIGAERLTESVVAARVAGAAVLVCGIFLAGHAMFA
jgi:predicted metal-binding membrane protein